MHAAVLGAFLLGPLLSDLASPEPAIGVRAFFVEPGILAPPPPPPPAAASSSALRSRPSGRVTAAPLR